MLEPNQFHELCLQRCSIRAFKPDPIPRETIDKIMKTAISAPSSMDRQPWMFYILTDQMRDRLAHLHTAILTPEKEERLRAAYGEEGIEKRRKLYSNLGNAPVAVVCFTDIVDEKPDKVSAALACENLILAANAEGYGALMMGSSLGIKDEISYLCGVDHNKMELVMCILIGTSNESPDAKERRKGRVLYASTPQDIK